MYTFTPPTAGVFDAPAVSISLNVEWRSFVIGVLEQLITAPAFGIGNDVYLRHDDPVWAGDDDAQFNADQEIEKLMSALANGQGLVMIPSGTTVSYAGTVAPDGWLLCDGSSHLKADYPELWGVLSLSGAIFELDTDNFITPDLRGRVVVGAGEGMGLTNRLIGQFDGAETHLLEMAELPSHGHIIQTRENPTSFGDSSIAMSGSGGGGLVDFESGDVIEAHDEPHNNMQPYFVLNTIIKT